MYDIKKYCKNDILEDNVEYVEKTTLSDNSYKSEDYKFNKFKKEHELTDDNDSIISIKSNWESLLKQFRYKKRFGFLLPNRLFRIDLTIVKSSIYNNATRSYMMYQSFKSADILNNPETYEFEIYIGNTVDGGKYIELYKSKGKNNNFQKFFQDLIL